MRYFKVAVTVLAIFISFSVITHARNGKQSKDYSGQLMEQTVSSLPVEDLSDAEVEGLLLMIEEEKLARDVYTALYEKWNIPIFSNISRSEQQHMDAIRILLKRYDIVDPTSGQEYGEFKKEEFQKLYKELVSTVNTSLVDALKIGATVEDLDIKDLQELLKSTDNTDIKVVYQNLMKGSRNHLRSFTKNLSRRSGDYTPQYISIKDYEAIISASHERGMINENGEQY